MDYSSYQQLVSTINRLQQQNSTLILGLDGCGGAGKSTLAKKLQQACDLVTIVHLDDFYHLSSDIMGMPPSEKPIGGDYDWNRVFTQLLEPLRNGRDARYQRYDWELDCLAEWHSVSAKGIVVVEGVYALRKEFTDKYDLRIWVDTPREIRLKRGLERDGEEARNRWVNDWMVSEDKYINEESPLKKADILIEGTK